MTVLALQRTAFADDRDETTGEEIVGDEAVVIDDGFVPGSLLGGLSFAELARAAPTDGVERSGKPYRRFLWPLSAFFG